MRLNSIFRSRRLLAAGLVAVGIVSLSLELLSATPQTPASSSVVSEPQAAANAPMLQLHGSWDLLWKDEKGVSLKAHCRIRQTGVVLTIHLSDASLANVDTRAPIEGLIEKETVSFRVHRKDGEAIVFSGKMDHGILYGTTSRGFSWMAIRNPE